MDLINKGRKLRPFDKDVKNFIDSSGLNNNSNLDVENLYNAESARFAINGLISRLKAIKDEGQTTSAWERIDMLTPALGGTEEMCAINLKTGLPCLTFNAFGLISVINKYGIGQAIKTDIIWNNSYYNNISIGCSFQEAMNPGLASSNLIMGSTDLLGEGRAMQIALTTSQDIILNSNGAWLTNKVPFIGTMGYSIDDGSEWITLVKTNKTLPILFGGYRDLVPSDKYFYIGGVERLDGSYLNEYNDSIHNCHFISKFLTGKELLAVNAAIRNFNAQLNRKI